MTLREYVRGPIRDARPDLPRHRQQRLIRLVDRFCDWLQRDIALSAVTIEQIDKFATSPDNGWFSTHISFELKSILRTIET